LASRKFTVRAAALTTAAALGVVAISLVLIVPAAVAGRAPCQTKNLQTGIEYKGASPLATAITAANAGDTISIWGTCVGNFEVGKNLTLKGQGKNATLDGNQAGRVLKISSGTTTIRDLTITNGKTTELGGGIYVGTAAVLNNVLVTGNTAEATSIGGGIEADLGSSLTLIDSTVSGNSAGSSGGIDMFRATASLTNSKVTGNHATRTPSASGDGCAFGDPAVLYACAGGIWNYQGTLALTNSTVSGNSAAYRGGGVTAYVRFFADGTTPRSGLTILSGSTSIAANTASDSGGGIYVNNPISTAGFGVHAADGTATYKDPISGATLPAWRGAVSGNTPDQCSPDLTIGGTSCT
jgi:predicted outer membrane repeat protein